MKHTKSREVKKKGFDYLKMVTYESLGDYWKGFLKDKYRYEYEQLRRKSLITLYAATRRSGIRKKFDKIEIEWEPKIIIKGISKNYD